MRRRKCGEAREGEEERMRKEEIGKGRVLGLSRFE